MYKDNIHKVWSPEIYFVWMVSQTFVKWINIIEFIINISAQFYRIVKYVRIMIMRSFNHDGNNSTKTVSPRLMPDVQYVYIQKFTKCFLIFENPFIILKSIIFIFINFISIYWSSFKAFVGILKILNGVYDKYF